MPLRSRPVGRFLPVRTVERRVVGGAPKDDGPSESTDPTGSPTSSSTQRTTATAYAYGSTRATGRTVPPPVPPDGTPGKGDRPRPSDCGGREEHRNEKGDESGKGSAEGRSTAGLVLTQAV
ncbi:hypothetical protein [Streptomyces sp. NPDC020747]|uniref:hypothetical protein n=1 Tax=Streptomyces sp. NPDC020747 TaxID=3365086 RepID=UPI0037B6B7E4